MSQQAGQAEEEEHKEEERRTPNISWNSRMKRRVGDKVLMLLSVCLLVAVVAVAVMLAACHLTLCFALHLSPCHKLWQVDSSRVCVLGNNLNKNNTRNASALSGSRCSIGRRLWHAAEGQVLSLLSLLSLERFLNVGNCWERLKEIRNFMFSI